MAESRGSFRVVPPDPKDPKGGPLSGGLIQTSLQKWDMAKSTRVYRFRCGLRSREPEPSWLR